MEAVAVFGLVCNVLQVVDMSWKIVKKASEIHKAGSEGLVENQDLKRLTDALKDTNDTLTTNRKKTYFGSSVEDEELKILCLRCDEIADGLLHRLEKYKGSDRKSIRDTIRAYHNLSKDKEYLQSTQKMLEEYRNTINLKILVQLRTKMGNVEIQQVEAFQRLDESLQQVIRLLWDTQVMIQESNQAQTNILLEAIRDTRARSPSPLFSELPDYDNAVGVSLPSSKDQHPILDAARKGDRMQIRRIIRQDAGSVLHAEESTGMTALHLVCQRGDVVCADYLLKKMANIGADDEDGMTPLHFAVQSGNARLVRLLKSRGADGSTPNDEGQTPLDFSQEGSETRFILMHGPALDARNENRQIALHFFSSIGNVEAVVSMLDQGADPDIPGHAGRSPLYRAVERGHLEVIDALLAGGANIEFADESGGTPLLYASHFGYYKSACRLVEHRANVHAINNFGFACISDACNHNRPAVARLLLENGANVNYRDPDGYLPLNRACRDGNIKIVQLLLQHKADANSSGGARGAWTPIHEVAEHGHLQCARLLLEHGAVSNCSAGDRQYAPINRAAKGGHIAVLTELLDRGKAQIDVGNIDGWTALHEAALYNYVDVARALIIRGANVNARNKTMGTPLKIAARENNTDVAALLLASGADVDIANVNNWTPLVQATFSGHLEMVNLLLDYKANTEISNDGGYTALNYAAMQGLPEIATALLDRGNADIEHRNRDGWSSVMEAAFWARKRILNDLIRRGACLDRVDLYGRDAITVAGDRGNTEMQQIVRDAKEGRLKSRQKAAGKPNDRPG